MVDKYGQRVKAALTQGFKDRPELVDDALWDAAAEIWEHPERFDPKRGGLGQYFYGAARNIARKRLREALLGERLPLELAAACHMEEGAVDDDPVEGDGGDGARTAGASQQELAAALRECIDQLGPLQRAIVVADLRARGSAPAEPIAREFETTTNSVWVSRNKAYSKLRKLMRDRSHFGGEEER